MSQYAEGLEVEDTIPDDSSPIQHDVGPINGKQMQYEMATDPQRRCGTCIYFTPGDSRCAMFQSIKAAEPESDLPLQVNPNALCSAWKGVS